MLDLGVGKDVLLALTRVRNRNFFQNTKEKRGKRR